MSDNQEPFSQSPRHDPPPGREGGADRSHLLVSLIRTIRAELEVALGRVAAVEAACAGIRHIVPPTPSPDDVAALEEAAALVRLRSGPIARPLFDLLVDVASTCDDPWRLLRPMIASRNGDFVRDAFRAAARLADEGRLVVSGSVTRALAERLLGGDEETADRTVLDAAARIAGHAPRAAGHADPLTSLFLDGDDGERRLAARLLDREDGAAPRALAEKVLGAEAYRVLRPYLDFTRAGHEDLLHLAPGPDGAPRALASIRRAEDVAGHDLVRDVIAELGWARVRFALYARELVAVSVGGSFPMLVSPAEAKLFARVDEAKETSRAFLFLAHGGPPPGAAADDDGGDAAGDDPVARFRAYNLVHAEVLADILDVAPLSSEKVERVLRRIERITEDYAALFSAYSEECAILPDVFRELKEKILRELGEEKTERHLSPELTRLVQMFEDPRSLGEVRTLHGLKRYLHQSGLRLGFRLVEAARATNRTVDIVTASPQRVRRVARAIHYVDFEPDDEKEDEIPYPVRVVAEGFARQLLHGQETVPEAKVFCYGNEVHYYLAFGNHPAFLRIDYAPPLRGGMIDLEYYGVSKNELDHHPNPDLDGIRLFFRELEFDVRIEATHIHARYDKERALDLGDLCRKAEALFRLVPYLMEVDWVIGSLALSSAAKRAVAEAWAKGFALWGVLPVRRLLTKDRTGIRVGTEQDAAGEREIPWDGRGPYRDRFREPPPADFLARLVASLDEGAREILPHMEDFGHRPVGQMLLEEALLGPLRRAASRGEIVATPEGYASPPRELAVRLHEAERFAEILGGPSEAIDGAARLAALVAPLERTLRFRATGSVNGYEVERARLTLRGEDLGLYVLRDAGGVIRLAVFARGDTLFRERPGPSGAWRENGSTDTAELAALLRRSNYLADADEAAPEKREGAERILARFVGPNPLFHTPPLPGERIVHGLKASPGRAVGTALFGTSGREPEDFDGAVLVAPSVRPEDNTYLYHAAGIVSTGGGILSHAGLIAIQFRKPSIIISGRWDEDADGRPVLHYRTLEYREETRDVAGFRVKMRRESREREYRLVEGDLVVLDADDGTLRVLGQDRETLALHDGFRHFGDAGRALARTTIESEVLVLRGRRLRARHLIEKLLRRLAGPVLARHAAEEILLGGHLAGEGGSRGEKAGLLSLLLSNRSVAAAAEEELRQIAREMQGRYLAVADEAKRRVPGSSFPYEVITLRLRALLLRESMEETIASLRDCGFEPPTAPLGSFDEIEEPARERLAALREIRTGQIARITASGADEPRLRHLLRQVHRLDLALRRTPEPGDPCVLARDLLARRDEEARERTAGLRVLRAADGGFELFPHIGWKAANLAELERLGGDGLVPPWFVVTDRAFREVLGARIGAVLRDMEGIESESTTLREAIDAVLAKSDLPHAQKSAHIRRLWDQVTLPRNIAEEVIDAYRALVAAPGAGRAEEDPEHPFVAIRSSAREEDAETAARAGEFDTFLFVRGEGEVLEFLKRAWSGLWTERAIHNRIVLGREIEDTGGGVIVQRIVWSRVAGVLVTVNAAEENLREMVINAGLGLGEGIVSGTVAADQVVVSKEADPENAPLRFRYMTGDKTEQVVFNARAGQGTVRAETLYHQRLRPALEYVELRELVTAASRLEAAYGYPLDIEFGIEGQRLWILQARPVATFLAALRDTVEKHPLRRRGESAPGPGRSKETAR